MDWITNEGLLGSFNEDTEISNISIRYSGDVDTVFSKISGVIPFEISNPKKIEDGIYEVSVYGNLPVVNETKNYYFSCRITDGVEIKDRYFYITSRNLKTEWDNTQSGVIAIDTLDSLNMNLKLLNPNGDEQFVKYSGEIPDGLTLSENGILYGSIENDETKSYSFTVMIKRNGKIVESIPTKTFTINVSIDDTSPPIWISDSGALGNIDNNNYSNIFLRAYALGGHNIGYEYDDNIQRILNIYGLYIVSGFETEDEKRNIVDKYQVSYSTIVGGNIIGKLSTKQSLTIGFDAYAVLKDDLNKKSSKRTFIIYLNKISSDQEIQWDSSEVYDLGNYKVGSYLNFDLSTLIMNDISCSFDFSGGELPKGLSVRRTGIIEGEVEYQKIGEYIFYVTASTSLTASRKGFRIKIEKGYGKNSYLLSLPINLEYINTYKPSTFSSDEIILGTWDANGQTDFSGLNEYRPIKSGALFFISGSTIINDLVYNDTKMIKITKNIDVNEKITEEFVSLQKRMIDDDTNNNTFDSLKGKFNQQYSYETYNPAYQIDILPKIDVCTCNCFDKTIMNALLDFGNDIVMEMGNIEKKDYMDDEKRYTIYYKGLKERVSDIGTFKLDKIKCYLGKRDDM